MYGKKYYCLLLLLSLLVPFIHGVFQSQAYVFVVEEATYTRLCTTKSILTVNGLYPGPTIYAHKGDTFVVKVINKSNHNITIHWHGVKQPRNPWSDGPEYITQCPIKPGGDFTQRVILSDEEGTLWWHAHSDWARATVHGAIVIYPKRRTSYPFPNPQLDVPIILGEWWNQDIFQVYNEFIATGGDPNISDAFTINGQPGDLYPCSTSETFKLYAQQGSTILLRIINAAMNDILFFAIANHRITVVAVDASYTKPLTTDYISIAPGQTMDVLLHTDQNHGCYYMAARAYSSARNLNFDNTTTTAILQYNPDCSTPISPYLPYYNDTNASYSFTSRLRSLGSLEHPVNLPKQVTNRIFSTLSINAFPCSSSDSCEGPNGTRFGASMSNISFVWPQVDILEAYYYHIKGVYRTNFPRIPHTLFNFTAEYQELRLEAAKRSTKVRVLKYNSIVEMTLQGTSLVAGIDHPMHLHGYSFYVIGSGFGNFDKHKDRTTYNLIDPPLMNTVIVPKNGWTTIRFRADNPGVWYMHCHFERHLTWGMMTTFIVKDGEDFTSRMFPPPLDMPPC